LQRSQETFGTTIIQSNWNNRTISASKTQLLSLFSDVKKTIFRSDSELYNFSKTLHLARYHLMFPFTCRNNIWEIWGEKPKRKKVKYF